MTKTLKSLKPEAYEATKILSTETGIYYGLAGCFGRTVLLRPLVNAGQGYSH